VGSGHHAGDKARYVHANYRFIVNPLNNYHAQAANADVHLDWNTVLQVLASAQTQAASCPICLSMPVAPRMAKCGHIFCLSCLIRYMHSTDEEDAVPEKKARWKKCPICWDTIYISDTRPVRWFTGQENELPVEGGDVVMRLVKRNSGSTLALPRDGAEELDPDDDVPWYHAAEVADYARIMKGGEDYMISQYDAEIGDLKRQRQEDELLFGDDATWTQKAIAGIIDAKEKLQGIGNPPDIIRIEKKAPRDPIQFEPPPEGVPEMYRYQQAVKSGQASSSSETTDISSVPSGLGGNNPTEGATSLDTEKLSRAIGDLQLNRKPEFEPNQTNKNATGPSKPVVPPSHNSGPHDQPYYFYQALPHFYLSPLDIRILKTAFGDYPQFPATILPRVEHVSTGNVVDDELRKRAKYLGHLPYGCEVNFLECDWTDLVVPEILERFHAETNKRRQRNREKDAREEKERIRAEKLEDEKRWAAARRKRPSYSSGDRPFSDQDFLPLSGSAPEASESAIVEADAPATSPPSPSRMQSRFGALASPSNSPPRSRTVWGTTAVGSSAQPPPFRGPVNDGWLHGWEDELLGQQDSEFLAPVMGDHPPPSASGRKKKNKKITLMSTNIQRGA
jgi:hypothetical protein